MSLATTLVSWKVAVEPCRLYYGWQTESNLGFQSHWIEVYGKEITPSTVAKDLGIYIDESLTYNKHITKTLSTCLHQIIQINRIKHLLDKKTILLLVNSFIFSKLYYYYYCSTVWSNTSKHNINKLQLEQNFPAHVLRLKSSITSHKLSNRSTGCLLMTEFT